MSEPELFRVTLDRAGRGEAGHPTRDDIRLLSPDFYVEPEERFAWMRANAPVYWDDATGIWGLASHEAVRIAAKEWQTFCSGQGLAARQLGAEHDQHGRPEHSFRRGIVKAGFTVRRVNDHEPYLRQKIGELIDAVAERGECDIVADIATPLPMYMIGTMMGLPESDHDQLLHWSDLFAAGDEEVRDEVVAGGRPSGTTTSSPMRRTRPRPGQRGPDQPDVRRRARRQAAQRHGPDVRVDARAGRWRRDHPPRHLRRRRCAPAPSRPTRRCCVGDPALIPSAVEEMLRWATPVKNMNRTATRDVELCGQQIHEGDRMLLLYPSANRDEAVFDDPHRFDVRRDPNPHVAFGAYGRHHCLGAPLARLELRVLFEELLARFADIELIDPAVDAAAAPRQLRRRHRIPARFASPRDAERHALDRFRGGAR